MGSANRGERSTPRNQFPPSGDRFSLHAYLSAKFDLLDNGPSYLIGFSTDGEISYINSFLAKKTGFPTQPKLPIHLSKLLSFDKASLSMEVLPQIWEGKSVSINHLLVTGFNGSLLPASGQVKPVYSKQQLIGAIGIFNPSQSNWLGESRFKALFLESSLGVAFCNLDGTVKAINPALENILGYKLSDFSASTPHPLFPDPEYPHPRALMTSHPADEKPIPAPWEELHSKSGRGIPCRIHCHPIRGRDGTLTEALIVVEDLSEVHATMKALQETEKRSRLLFEMAPIGIGIRDLETNTLVDTNLALTKMFGPNRTDIIGIHRSNYILEEDAEAEAELLERLKRKEIKSYQMEKVYRSVEGKTTRGIMTRILIESNGKEYAVAYVSDVSQFKEQGMRLEAQNNKLVKMNEELDRFVYSATHELRAPLTSIQGLIELIRGENQSVAVERLLKLQERSIEKLDSYIRKIVHHSHNKSENVNREEVDFRTLLENLREEVLESNSCPDADITLDVRQKTAFYSDNNRLRVILTNVLLNALQFSDPKKDRPKVIMRVRAGVIRTFIEVQDNGIGLPDDLHERVFDMFFRASIRSKGSGLGLYIAREMIEKLGGEIELDSNLGEGTTVRIQLPSLSPEKD